MSSSTLLLDCAPAQCKSLLGPTSSIPLLFLQELPVGKGSETRGEKRDISQGKTSMLSIYVLLENFLGRAEKKRGPTIKLTEDLDPHHARLMLAPKGPEIIWISGYQGQPGLYLLLLGIKETARAMTATSTELLSSPLLLWPQSRKKQAANKTAHVK